MDLGLELAGKACSAAIANADGIRAQDFTAARGRGLMKAIEVLLPTAQARAGLDRIVVGVGPGSYTGLRIACSAARMLAWSLDLSLLGVNSFAAAAEDALRRHQAAVGQEVHLMVDAFRGEWYHACYVCEDLSDPQQSRVAIQSPARILSAEAAQAALPAAGLVIGDGAKWPGQPAWEPFAPKAAALLRLAADTRHHAVAEPLYLRQTSYRRQGE